MKMRELWDESHVVAHFFTGYDLNKKAPVQYYRYLPQIEQRLRRVRGDVRAFNELERKRGLIATDWLIRTFTPPWLRLAGLRDDAAALEALPELNTGRAEAFQPLLKAASSSVKRARAQEPEPLFYCSTFDAPELEHSWDAALEAANDMYHAASYAACGPIGYVYDIAHNVPWLLLARVTAGRAQTPKAVAALSGLWPLVASLEATMPALIDRIITAR